MLTIPDLLERYARSVHGRDGYFPSFFYPSCKRIEVWSELLDAKQQGLRKVPSVLNNLNKYRSEMDGDELELLDSLIAEQNEADSKVQMAYTRVSLHMDTFRMLEKAAMRKGMSKSEVAEIAMREYFKSIGIE